MKDEDGNPISKKAAKHFAKYRVRCNECAKVFCRKCKSDPYHTGKTCEEFQDYKEASKCRFCLEKLKKPNRTSVAAFRAVCQKDECQDLLKTACDKQLPCGHFCQGSKYDDVCIPCLHPDCVKAVPALTLEQTEDDYCNLCFSAGLGQAPCIQLDCKHIFHEECIMRVLEQKWTGPRINFKFTECPGCNRECSSTHKKLQRHLGKAKELQEKINEMALKRAKHEDIDRDARLQEAPFNGDLLPYALARLSYYMCYECK